MRTTGKHRLGGDYWHLLRKFLKFIRSGRNGKSATYKYLSDGQRYIKTTGGKTTTYLYNNGLLLSETTGKNAFGDVIAIYRNSDSVLIGTYEYDLWGNPISAKEAASGRDTDGILQKNPFRYRCYYYDVETGVTISMQGTMRRVISADDQLTEIGETIMGYNLYAYCQNSPMEMLITVGIV